MKIKDLLKKIAPIIFIIIIALILIVWLVSMKKSPKRSNGNYTLTSVPIIEVVTEDIQIKVPVIGSLTAQKRVDIYSEVQGILEPAEKEFLEGVSFKKGETLLLVNSKDAEYTLLSKRSSFLTLITQILPDIKYEHPESEADWLKYLADFDIEKETQPLPTPNSDREKYYIAGKGIYQSYYEIKNLEHTLSKYQIRAPFNGTVVTSNIKPGTLVRSGQKLGEFMSTDLYDFESSVTVEQAAMIKIGDNAILNSGTITTAGKVSRINDIVDSGTLMVNIFITVNGSELKEGMYLTGEVYSSTIVHATEIPRRIITNDNTVYEVKDSTIIEQKIEIVALSGDTAVVTGLTSGQTISTKSQNIYDGQKVTVL